MKRQLITLFVVGLTLWAAKSQGALTLNLNNLQNSSLQFNTDGSFQFNSAATSGSQWHITTSPGGTGSADGFVGSFASSGVKWSTDGYTSSTDGFSTLETVNVEKKNTTFTIYDGNTPLTGTLNWAKLSVISGSLLSGSGYLDAKLVVNVTDITYSGSNADLKVLAAGKGQAYLSLSLTLGANVTLSQLLTTGASGITYSGSISPVPESGTTLAGAGALALVLLGVGLPWKRSQTIRIGK